MFLAGLGWQTPSLRGAGVDAGNSAAPVDLAEQLAALCLFSFRFFA